MKSEGLIDVLKRVLPSEIIKEIESFELLLQVVKKLKDKPVKQHPINAIVELLPKSVLLPRNMENELITNYKQYQSQQSITTSP